MCKILLVGYYGFNNIGDEAILEMFLNIIKERLSNENISVLTAKPKKTKKEFGVEGIDRYSFYKVNKAIFQSDILIVGGGSLLQDVTSKKSIYYYLYLIFMGRLFNKKTALLSQGIGPIKRKFNRFLTKIILNNVDYISVRDENSIKALEKIGIKKEKILFSADPVIHYDSNCKKTEKEKINIGLSLREWHNSDIINKITKLIKKFDSKYYDFTFIPFHHDEDVKILNNINEKLDNCHYIKEKLTIQETCEKIHELDLMIGVRLHSLIFAVACDIPVIGISYDPKVEGFLKSIGEKKVFYIQDFNVDDLYDEIISKLQNKNLNKEKINALKKSKITNINIIENLINRCNNG